MQRDGGRKKSDKIISCKGTERSKKDLGQLIPNSAVILPPFSLSPFLFPFVFSPLRSVIPQIDTNALSLSLPSKVLSVPFLYTR